MSANTTPPRGKRLFRRCGSHDSGSPAECSYAREADGASCVCLVDLSAPFHAVITVVHDAQTPEMDGPCPKLQAGLACVDHRSRAIRKLCRERVKMSGLRSTSNVRSDAVAGLWAGWGEQGSSTPSTGFAAERTYAAVCTRRIGSIRVPSAS